MESVLNKLYKVQVNEIMLKKSDINIKNVLLFNIRGSIEMETSRCRLEILQESDYHKVKELYFNEAVRKYLGGVVSTESFNNSFRNILTYDDSAFYWIVRLKDKDTFIGLVSLDKHHDGVSTEVSYQFMPQFWGYGYAEEVIRKIIYFAFKELRLDRIIAETQCENKNSCKLLEKVGMKLQHKVSRFAEEQYVFSIFR